ncbi:MAG TPA: hypothetical protein VFS39_03525 [Nitrospira sp.]|nr:hypothetical protein [Nitrospira sp.]
MIKVTAVSRQHHKSDSSEDSPLSCSSPRFRLSLLLAAVLWLVADETRSSSLSDQPQEHHSEVELLYVSDYFSFVGQDETGRVAFALDNNRGRDGAAFQAEHFVVLHDERQGWITSAGNGLYDNPLHELQSIPDSSFFHFVGTPVTGLTISSEINELTLHIEPIIHRSRHEHEGAVTWMGSAPARLTWKTRSIPGRVIYEYLRIPNFNRLTRTYWDLWNDFQGLYLTTGDGGDLYLHSQRSERLGPLVGRLAGFTASDEETEHVKELRFEITEREWALGFYRWPEAWHITWQDRHGAAGLSIRRIDRRRIAGWVIGGFSMAIVTGELDYGGKTVPVYGFAELLM